MNNERIYQMKFADLYPLYVNKAVRKNRTEKEVDEIIFWLTGYTKSDLTGIMNHNWTVQSFFEKAKLNENAVKITGLVCGVRVEEIGEPLMRQIRYLDKLIDELAKGKALDKILRK